MLYMRIENTIILIYHNFKIVFIRKISRDTIMVTVGLCLLDTMAFIESAVMLSRMYALILDSNNTVDHGSSSEDDPRTGPTREYEL